MTTLTFKQTLNFIGSRVLVAGDLMLDQYWLGDTQRISPESPVPVVKVNNTETRLGGAANAALNAKSLGADISLAGIIGEDDNGQQLQAILQEKNIEDLCVKDANARTITKLRMISRGQQMLRADFEDPFPIAAINALTNSLIKQVQHYPVILLSDYAKGSLMNCAAIIQAANQHGAKVLVDPKGQDFERYRGAYCLTPNLAEFEAVTGPCTSEQDLFCKAHQLIKDYDLQTLLLTRSENGMTLFLQDGRHHHFNTVAREVFDVTGAGDTVIATFATALAKGYALEESIELANAAAGIVVGRMGAATVSPLELKLALENNASQSSGITNLEQLKALVAFEQSLGKKVVFTNGCFDILHKGHAQYLLEAGQLGDRLIVAINSDESVKRLKGPERPINTVDDRMMVISSLKSVDWVISFETDTPEDLLREIKPDILVKGGDYGIEEIVGADIVTANGGSVSVLSLQKGVSTTNIIDSIKNQ